MRNNVDKKERVKFSKKVYMNTLHEQNVNVDLKVNDVKQTYSKLQNNMVRLSVNDVSMSALVDTGANISCLSFKMYTKYGFDKLFPLRKSPMPCVTGVGGSVINVLGIATLPLHINRLQLFHSFYVLERMNHSLILGVDFLKEQNATINFKDNVLSLQGGVSEIGLYKYATKSHLVRVIGNISVPPKSENIIPVKIRVTVDEHNPTGIVEPLSTLPTKTHLLGARCLVQAEGKQLVYRLLNPTEATITLNDQQPIATFTPINDTDIIAQLTDDSSPHETYTCQAPSVNQVDSQSKTDNDFIAMAHELGFDLTDSDLSELEKNKLLSFIGQHRDVFAKDITELGTTNLHYHHIDTGNSPPVRQTFYRTSPQTKENIEQKVQEMLDNDIIEPSMSEWHQPVVLIRKKCGDYRFVVDYRQLNKVTKPINFPLPRLDDIIDTIAESKAQIFSVMDMANGFWQIPLDPTTKHKSAFITHNGVYNFKKLPYGLMNSPACFNMVMSEVLRGINWKCAIIYVDDIIVFSNSFDDHLHNLSLVFDRLRRSGLKLKPEKCKFAVKSVKYLGHVFSKDGIQVDTDKIKVVETYPVPKTQKDVRSFLGLCNYYKKFISGYSKICAPLNNMLKKDEKSKLNWDNKCQDAFDQLKTALTTSPILTYPDFDKDFILYTDASETAIGYILGQKDDQGKEKVICYGGRSLKPNEKNWPISEKEGLALVEGIKYFHIYLANKKFTVLTDHIALKWLQDISQKNGRLYRWSLMLQGYNFDIIHKPGKKHGNADALSKRAYSANEEVSIKKNGNSQPLPQLKEHHSGNTLTSVNQVSRSNSPANTHTLPKYEHETHSMQTDNQQQSNKTVEYKLHYSSPIVEQNRHTPSTNITTDKIKAMHLTEQQYLDTSPAHHIAEILTINEPSISELQHADPEILQVIRYLQHELSNKNDVDVKYRKDLSDYFPKDDVLYHMYFPRGKGHQVDRMITQLVVPKSLRQDILLTYHDSLQGCHQGSERTFHTIRLKYYWPSMFSEIDFYCKSCETCQKTKRYYHAQHAPLNPLPPGNIFSRIHIDILGPLPTSDEGFKYVLLIVDSFSKWPESFPLKTMEASEVAQILYDEIICRYGAPESLLSDRGANFMSKLIKSLCDIFQITKVSTSSYHPQTNATCERFNSVILNSLRAYCSQKQTHWPDYLPSIMMAYRISPATQSTLMSPYYILFGKECRLPLDVALTSDQANGTDISSYVEKLIPRVEFGRKLARDNILQAQNKYKAQHDKVSREPQFKVKDRVWLSSTRAPVGLSKKMTQKYVGPYYIAQTHDNHTYTIRSELDDKQMKSHVHANRLKPYFDPDDRKTNTPPDQSNLPNKQGLNPPSQSTVQNFDNHVKDNSSTEVNDQNLQDEVADRMIHAEKILKSQRQNQITWYKVKFKDRRYPSLWYRFDLVPRDLIREFQIHKTAQGYARKRRSRNKK